MATLEQTRTAPPAPPARRWWQGVSALDLVPYALLLALVVALIVLQPNLARISWVERKADSTLTLILVTVGQSMVIFTGGIDLSVGGVLSVSNAIAATKFGSGGPEMFFWMGVILAFGLFAGFLNGIIIAYLRLQPFIATLATWSIWGGLALWVLPTDGGSIPDNLYKFATGSVAGLPKSLLLLALVIALWLVFKRTRFGVSVFGLGSSAKASFLSGVNINRIQVLVYTLSGLFAALAGIYRTVQATSGSPVGGNPFILTSVAAVVIGGTSLAGGRGSIVSNLVGAFILTLIGDLIFFAGISSYYTSFFQGLLLILAVALYSIVGYAQRRRAAR